MWYNLVGFMVIIVGQYSLMHEKNGGKTSFVLFSSFTIVRTDLLM